MANLVAPRPTHLTRHLRVSFGLGIGVTGVLALWALRVRMHRGARGNTVTEQLAPALDGSAAAALPTVPAPAPAPQRLPVRFTGNGGEYFRIWIVNLLLTVVTLGIWSAWAKVRKTRYFWSNTQLGGAAFQYHGNPAAILRGRLVAGALVVAYSVAGRISLTAGMVAGAVLVVLGPWFFYLSMRFKLANTSWRGLRFGFDSSPGQGYAALAPGVAVGVLFVGALFAMQRIAPGEKPNPLPFALAELAAFAFVPWIHARLKAYQHGRARYGTLAFEFEPSAEAFYALYIKSSLVALPFVAAVGAAMVGAWAATRSLGGDPAGGKSAFIPILVATYASTLVAYAFAGAFFVSRLQRLVWTRTHAGPLRFSTTVRARGLMRVWIVNGLLTLLTLGLYWPWAAVAIARYRLECMSLEADAPIETVCAGGQPLERSAMGEGAIDFLGWDIGL